LTDDNNLKDIPQATVIQRKRIRLSVVWIIPILAAVVAIGIAAQRFISQGPIITISFKAGAGIEAGKTFIRYKDVKIGQVVAVELSEDFERVLVRAKIAKHASRLMVEDAKFWIVEPRISLSGVSGLETLLSGNYIGFEAGKSEEDARSFTGHDSSLAVTREKGSRYLLKSRSLGSLSVDSPVYYRQVNIGRVTAYNLAPDGKSVDVTVFVQSPYDKHVTNSTIFWNASGMNITVDSNGVEVHTESLAALIGGGVAFDVPEFQSSGTPVAANTVFTLYRNRTLAMKRPDPDTKRYALFFNESVRGLSVGAPVTLFGLPVGEVTSVGLTFDQARGVFRPQALITFFPSRLDEILSPRQRSAAGEPAETVRAKARVQALRQAIDERGLRAQLRTGSYVTGELYVALEYHPESPKPKTDWTREPVELPVVTGGFGAMEARLASILAKIDKLPFDAIGTDLAKTLASANLTLKNAADMLKSLDEKLLPESSKTLEELRRAIASADRVLANADSTFLGKDAAVPQDLRDTLQEVGRAARSVRLLVDYLERHPEALIRGKTEGNK
jgi:paraquat-inducible protein B